jgi:uncharacterized membrane protein YphA (DoxX/SURF4 family)
MTGLLAMSISGLAVRRDGERREERSRLLGLPAADTPTEKTMPTSSARTANRLLWTAQTLAALLFLFAGSMKFVMPAEKMQQGPIVFPMAFLYFIGVCECLGALGLILPGLTRVRTELTPLAAAGLTIIMIGATTVSILAMGAPAGIFPAVVGIVTAWIAYGRTRVAPLAHAPRRTLRVA